MEEVFAEASHQSSVLDPDSKATHSALSGYLDTDDLISAADDPSVRDISQNAVSGRQGRIWLREDECVFVLDATDMYHFGDVFGMARQDRHSGFIPNLLRLVAYSAPLSIDLPTQVVVQIDVGRLACLTWAGTAV